ncbi:MAG TPA: hypothetical protein VGP25_22000 [Gemmatimonadaceae bacterium]|jgi:hypothetical protein|nr:hypothetical protein [Gemmatimonadaceae bacterium]
MSVIIMEGVLFVALIAAGGALLYWVILYFTPVGVRLRQTSNRRQIERAAELVCSEHGRIAEDKLVRLASGERVCPDCYKEIVNA